jgi:hypothetical protein
MRNWGMQLNVTLVKKGGVFAAEYLITQSSVYW